MGGRGATVVAVVVKLAMAMVGDGAAPAAVAPAHRPPVNRRRSLKPLGRLERPSVAIPLLATGRTLLVGDVVIPRDMRTQYTTISSLSPPLYLNPGLRYITAAGSDY
ncbi:hypothetical protein Dda_4715 [Drechslerella dactyloides]|uniref:Secreted protein n=1 Tax=Drechslerella dactyloides TaxID=74499 RepID=A0AAD6IXF3_DREDA|nr:hypothetical protein Dda_4715 [Drechslerella dactyloides]